MKYNIRKSKWLKKMLLEINQKNYLKKSINGILISVNKTTIGLVNVVILIKSKDIRIDMIQNSMSKGDKNLALLVTKVNFTCAITIKQVAIEKRKATIKKRLPDGNKLVIFATERNNNENPNNF
jgi:hypothetical protein